jgi:hypothetical protein
MVDEKQMIKRSISFEQILSKGIWRFWRWPLGQKNIPKPHIDPSFRSWTCLRSEFTFIVGVGIYPHWKPSWLSTAFAL